MPTLPAHSAEPARSGEHDDYVTNLANTQSQSGIRQGTLFCQQNVSIFTEVLALQKDADLVRYAASKTLPQPIEVVACPEPTRTAQATGTATRR